MTAPPLPPGTGGAGRGSVSGGGYRERVLPTTQSILWNPVTASAVPRRGPGGAFPVFLEQQAIAAVHAHHQAAGKQGMMGFLVGDLCRCPTSQVKYVVVDSTVRLNQAVYGDKTLVIISRLWDRLQEELRRSDGHLIGWYHSHPPIGLELAPGDVETHMQYFTRPWHTAMVLGAEPGGPVAGLFRPGPGETFPNMSLPFYELIDDPERLANGFKTSILPWQNFATDDPAVVRPGEGVGPKAGAAGRVKTRSTLETVTPAAGRAPTAPPRPVSPTGPPPQVPAPPVPSAPAPPPPRAPTAPPAVRRPAATQPPAKEPEPAAPSVAGTPPPGKAAPPAKRGAQLKPPHGALSNLPLLSVGGYDVGPVDIRPSDPSVMTPQAVPALRDVPPPKRKETAGAPPALKVEEDAAAAVAPARASLATTPAAVEPKVGKPWGMLTAAVVVLAMLGAGGWYFLLGPGRAQFDALRHRGGGAAASQAPAAAPPPPVTTATPGVPPPNEGATTSVSQAAPPPVATPAADSGLARFDQLAESVTLAVRGYGDRAKLFDNHQLECAGLSHGLVTVEDIWTSYNIQGKKRKPTLDAARTAQDQTLYAAVDSVERHFDRSQCARP